MVSPFVLCYPKLDLIAHGVCAANTLIYLEIIIIII